MAKYHINPETGNAGTCTAVKHCRFGESSAHYDSAEGARAAYEVAQKALASMAAEKPKSFDEIRTTPQPEDIQEALTWVSINLANHNREYSWENLQGGRRTVKAEKEYNKKLEAIVNDDERHSRDVKDHALNLAAKRAYSRAFKVGVSIDPVAEEKFEEYWNDDSYGYGEKGLKEKLTSLETLRDRFEAGEASASYVVGTGLRNPGRVAKDYLERQISENRESLATRGRSNDVNTANVNYHLRAKND